MWRVGFGALGNFFSSSFSKLASAKNPVRKMILGKERRKRIHCGVGLYSICNCSVGVAACVVGGVVRWGRVVVGGAGVVRDVGVRHVSVGVGVVCGVGL